jgi:hypothetical protein
MGVTWEEDVSKFLLHPSYFIPLGNETPCSRCNDPGRHKAGMLDMGEDD